MLTAGLLLLLCRAGWAAQPDLHAWRWQRTVTPTSAGEQCVVLDTDLYAHAAPGLRDVRLVQQGREVAYALEESYDESGPTNAGSDRSQFTTVLQVPLSVIQAPAAIPAKQFGSGVLPRGVPVERMLLVPAPTIRALSEHKENTNSHLHLSLTAMPIGPGALATVAPQEAEVIDAVLTPGAPRLLTAIGANLQSDANISVAVSTRTESFSQVLLQMRQRSLCFHSVSSAPLLLLFGNATARPVHYDYATQFHPVATPVLAGLGPIERNLQYRSERPHAAGVRTRTQTSLLAGAVVVATILLLAPALRRH